MSTLPQDVAILVDDPFYRDKGNTVSLKGEPMLTYRRKNPEVC
ncbi:hypothetical protein [Lederbergia citrea]|nr:hypothetical protein [Lederbergia citrea]